VAQLCDANMPTELLAHWVRDRGAMTVEHAVHKLTAELADLFGVRDRGRLAPGAAADVVVFDLDALDPGPLRRVRDLPGDEERLIADEPRGVEHVLVNGVPITTHGESHVQSARHPSFRQLVNDGSQMTQPSNGGLFGSHCSMSSTRPLPQTAGRRPRKGVAEGPAAAGGPRRCSKATQDGSFRA